MTREEAIKRLETHIAYHQSGAWPFTKTDEAMQMAIAALRERDALMAEIKDMCFLCRHYNSGKGNELCECCDDEDNFEWRGAQDNRLESNTDKVVDSDQFNRWISVEERLPEPPKEEV